jgi:hypothetical protein
MTIVCDNRINDPVFNQGVVKKIQVTTALKRAGFTKVKYEKGAPNFGFQCFRYGGWLSVEFTDQYHSKVDVDITDLLAMYQEALTDVGINSWVWENSLVVPMRTRHLYRSHVETNKVEVDRALRKTFERDGYRLADGLAGVVASWVGYGLGTFTMASRMADTLRCSDFDAEVTEIESGEWVCVVASRKAN